MGGPREIGAFSNSVGFGVTLLLFMKFAELSL
jgi:hypothetical protein